MMLGWVVATLLVAMLAIASWCKTCAGRPQSSPLYAAIQGERGVGRREALEPPAPVFPASSSDDKGAMAPGISGLPGFPLNPISVNQFSPQNATTKLAALGSEVMQASEEATEPLPPNFTPLPELGPQRLWQPTWQGCAPTFVDRTCEFFFPNPRLWARDLNELQFRRGLSMGQDNLFEPVRARQSYIQLLAAEARSKKDPYTRATWTNSLSSTACSQLARQVPEYVNF
jgi:hypothetical protein